MIDGVQLAGGGHVVRIAKVVEGGVERQPGAHPQEHARAESVARRPEVVLAVACGSAMRNGCVG